MVQYGIGIGVSLMLNYSDWLELFFSPFTKKIIHILKSYYTHANQNYQLGGVGCDLMVLLACYLSGAEGRDVARLLFLGLRRVLSRDLVDL